MYTITPGEGDATLVIEDIRSNSNTIKRSLVSKSFGSNFCKNPGLMSQC